MTEIVKENMPWCCAFQVLGDFGLSVDSDRTKCVEPIYILNELRQIADSVFTKPNFTFTLTEYQYDNYKSELDRAEITPVFTGRNNGNEYDIYLFAGETRKVKTKLKELGV